ncbi:YlmC/YmxH family sporulation protein [Tumebacillus lipolyticus]|uniref:YlmC/YmxH family sporulation protein n=1 Tax=Tumebacillus lipolyticus TaxID=1280370 RepID=A0ABW4ZZ73_9BACL
MKLSELAGKELIDVRSGTRVGLLGSADLFIDEESGVIHSIVITQGGFSFGKKRDQAVIPWAAIHKIGPDMILLDSAQEANYGVVQYGTRN